MIRNGMIRTKFLYFCSQFCVQFYFVFKISTELAAATYHFLHYAIKEKRKKQKRLWQIRRYSSRDIYGSKNLMANLKLQSVNGLYNNFIRMRPDHFELLIQLIGKKIRKITHQLFRSYYNKSDFSDSIIHPFVCMPQ